MTDAQTVSAPTPAHQAPEIDLKALLEAGCHFGHQARKWHPQMKPWIYTEKDGVHIFDLVKTAGQLEAAYNMAFELGKNGQTLVVVGTKRQAREIVKEAATNVGALYINSRWLGGLLTNWDQVQKSLKRMMDIETGLQNDTFKGYTKFERVQLEKEMNRLQRFFVGIKTLKKKPDCLFVIDPVREKNAVIEAKLVGVPVMAMVDSNGDPRVAAIPIPANDDAMTSIKLIVETVLAGYQAGKNEKK